MRILLLRHGAAVKNGGGSDLDRPLTPRGISDVERAARGLQRAGVRPRSILTSPAQRCKETAQLAADALGFPSTRVEVREALAGGTPARRLLEQLGSPDLPEDAELLIVGHDPDLVALASRLLAADDKVRLRFEPAGCACIEVDAWPPAGHAALLWLLTPSQLAQIGASPA